MDALLVPRPLGLPDFPWDLLNDARRRAAEHPDGVCDLSVGTPVDATPEAVQKALSGASNAPGYPTVNGTQEVRDAIRQWGRSRGMVDPGDGGVIPTIGSKEAVAWIPLMLGVRPGDTVLVPEVAYPTYDIGARLAGANVVTVDPTAPDTWPQASMVYLNSPGNPNGHVLSTDELRAAVVWARTCGALIVSDECYAALPWQEPYISEGVPSLLRSDICGDDPAGLLVLYSLSKQSNLAGYRAAFIYGDPRLVSAIVQVRKHSGMMVPTPVQVALAAALTNPEHVATQYQRYAQRRHKLHEALTNAALICDEASQAGLYLWVRRPGESARVGSRNDCWNLVDLFAQLGIIVAPGDFYGTSSGQWVRVALTATDERIDAAAQRLNTAGAQFFRCDN